MALRYGTSVIYAGEKAMGEWLPPMETAEVINL